MAILVKHEMPRLQSGIKCGTATFIKAWTKYWLFFHEIFSKESLHSEVGVTFLNFYQSKNDCNFWRQMLRISSTEQIALLNLFPMRWIAFTFEYLCRKTRTVVWSKILLDLSATSLFSPYGYRFIHVGDCEQEKDQFLNMRCQLWLICSRLEDSLQIALSSMRTTVFVDDWP